MTDNKNKGDLYEIYINNYIQTVLNKKAYLWSQAPEELLIKIGLIENHNELRLMRIEKYTNPIMDTGIDIIIIDNEETLEYSFVQCKNGYDNGLTINNLSGFMAWMAIFNNVKGYVYYTNKLSTNLTFLKNLDFNNRISFIKKTIDNDMFKKSINNDNIF